jgi:very-short-patch-repair endonuclease
VSEENAPSPGRFAPALSHEGRGRSRLGEGDKQKLIDEECPPHPDAARPPSPTRGEGNDRRGERKVPRTKLNSLGARSKQVLGTQSAASQPSPSVGEGCAKAPGEGDASAPPKHRNRDVARKLRRTLTDAERKLWSLLRNRKLSGLKFRRQVPLGPYVADFLSFEARLIIEADGSQHSAVNADMERNAWFKLQGFRIARFWNNEILTTPEGVLQRVVEFPRCTPQKSFAPTPIRTAHE